MSPLLSNELWRLANVARHRRFAAALERPTETQERILRGLLRANAGTEYGRAQRFDELGSLRDFQQRVPPTTFDDYQPFVQRIRAGERGLLTAAPVQRLVPSSGSTAARKLVPYTRALRAEFERGIGPWIVDLFRDPRLRGGRAYFSISPALAPAEEPSAVPVGFEDDADYLGGVLGRIVARSLAVSPLVHRIRDVAAFRHATLLFLLGATDLALISVWHPSFLALLLRDLREHWERLLDDLRRGSFSPPGDVDAATRAALTRRLRPSPRRADELRRADPARVPELWPRLALVSCWGDGPAEGALRELARSLAGVPIQRKGLIATEAFVSLPFEGAHPLAIRGHFFEFVDDVGRARTAGELEAGAEYALLVTTGGGLYRYRLGDRVRVDGFVGCTPSLRFAGRDDHVVDLVGEKLNERFVSAVLDRLLSVSGHAVAFAMLAPVRADGASGYGLFLQAAPAPPPGLADRLEALLRENPHYDWAVRLGQLAPARVFRVRAGAHATYLERQCALGRRLGDVKPCALSPHAEWERAFDGVWLTGCVPIQSEP